MKPLTPLEVLDNFAQTACAYRMAYAAVKRRQRAIFKAARARLGVTQAELAVMVGVSTRVQRGREHPHSPQICRMESGATKARAKVLVKLAGLL